MIVGLILISSIVAFVTACLAWMVLGLGFLSALGAYAATGVATTLGLAVSRAYLCPLLARLRATHRHDAGTWDSVPVLIRSRD